MYGENALLLYFRVQLFEKQLQRYHALYSPIKYEMSSHLYGKTEAMSALRTPIAYLWTFSVSYSHFPCQRKFYKSSACLDKLQCSHTIGYKKTVVICSGTWKGRSEVNVKHSSHVCGAVLKSSAEAIACDRPSCGLIPSERSVKTYWLQQEEVLCQFWAQVLSFILSSTIIECANFKSK